MLRSPRRVSPCMTHAGVGGLKSTLVTEANTQLWQRWRRAWMPTTQRERHSHATNARVRARTRAHTFRDIEMPRAFTDPVSQPKGQKAPSHRYRMCSCSGKLAQFSASLQSPKHVSPNPRAGGLEPLFSSRYKPVIFQEGSKDPPDPEPPRCLLKMGISGL